MTAGAAVGAIAGAIVAAIVAGMRISTAPDALMRRNVSGRCVPAVLGDAVAAGALAGLGGAVAATPALRTGSALEVVAATAVLVAGMWGAGRFDDLRGDETDRGFRGHLRAAAARRLTGGTVKLAAGGALGLGAGILVTDGAGAISTGAVIALAANLFNLLDRAPGRAGKAWFLVAIPVVLAGSGEWVSAVAAAAGGLAACLVPDLRERGMLGDAGSNPLGALWGLGLALALGEAGRWIAAAGLLALNLISERRSFSAAIEKAPVLRAVDRFGRRPAAEEPE